MTQLNQQFDYSELDLLTADFLKVKEFNIREIVGKSSTQVGQELKEAQDRLSGSNQHNGMFERWYTGLGYKKQTVYNMINRYNLLVQNLDKQDELEFLPDSLLYEASKPSANQEVVQAVLNGEIRSHKDFKQLEKQLKETERERVRLENESVHYRQLLNQERSKPSQVVTKEVQVIPESTKKKIEDLEFQNNNLRHGYQETKDRLQQFELMNTIDFDAEQSRKQREKMQHEADYNTLELCTHVKNFLEKAAISSFMQGAITSSDPITKRKLSENIAALESFTTQIKAALNGRILGGIVNE